MAELTAEEKTKLLADYEDLKREGQRLGFEPAEPSTTSKVLTGGLKGLDYQRSAVQRGLLELLGQRELLTPDEQGALNPTNLKMAPGYGDVLERKFGDFPGSQTVGFGLDLALDPTMYETGGTAAIARLAKIPSVAAKLEKLAALRAIDVPAKALEKIGELIYKSPFKKADEVARQQGAKLLPSEIMLEAGKTGSASKMAKEAEALKSQIGGGLNTIDKIADESGAVVDLNKAFSRTEEIAKKEGWRGFDKESKAAQDFLESLKAKAVDGQVPFSQARGFKEALGVQARSERGLKNGKAAQILETARKAVAEELDNAASAVSKNAADGSAAKTISDDFLEANQKYSSLKKAEKTFKQKAAAEENKINMMSAIDALAAGGGLTALAAGAGPAGFAPLAAKKAYDLLGKGTGTKTRMGKLLLQFGQSGLATPALIQGTREAVQGESPWSLLVDEEQKKNGR